MSETTPRLPFESMQLLVVRHAIAEDRDEFARSGSPDRDRPLTKLGRRRMRAVAQGIHRLVPAIDKLIASPLVRTIQTAEIIAKEYGGPAPIGVRALEPDRAPSEFLRWLYEQEPGKTIAAVGHDPNLPRVVGLLLAGTDAPVIAIKKGGACFLRIEGAIDAGGAVLHWALAPSHLRDLGR